MENYEVIDNFLEHDTFKRLQSEIMSTTIPWAFCSRVFGPEDNSGQFYFIHSLYEMYLPRSPFFEVFAKPFFKALGDVKSVIRMKINLYPRTGSNLEKHGLHVDFKYPHKGAVFYINTCDGYTGLGDKKIYSVENRVLKFDSSQEHHSTNCTDQQARFTVNINYF